MKVLVIGSGGREHAICHSFAKSKRVSKLFCANGNAGIAELAECVDIRPDDVANLVRFADEQAIDLTFVGGETSLALGVVDEFELRGLRIVGPSKAATRLESSKAFAKDFMARHGVPAAKFFAADSPEAAVAVLERGEFGNAASAVVVKADGLAAGKGVVVAETRAAAIKAVNEMTTLVGTEAAGTIVLEECLFGPEVSLLMFASGEDFALMPATRDHKRIGDGDSGPNTGGMGTITDESLLSKQQTREIIDQIIKPTLRGCVEEGFSFRGILFLGLMMTESGPKLLEYNVRFGDPETQSILVRLVTDLVEICDAVVENRLHGIDIHWKAGSSACVVIAAERYPAAPRKGDLISGLDGADAAIETQVFHAGTSSGPDGGFLTSGGRVLGVTSTGPTLAAALERAYAGVKHINFTGMQYRKDIGR